MQNEQNFALATLQKRTSMANVAAELLSHRNSCPRKKSRCMSRRYMTIVAVGLCPASCHHKLCNFLNSATQPTLIAYLCVSRIAKLCVYLFQRTC